MDIVLEGIMELFGAFFVMLFNTPFPFWKISWGIFLVGMVVLELVTGFISGLLPSSSNEKRDK